MGKWTESPWQELPNVTMLNTKIVFPIKTAKKNRRCPNHNDYCSGNNWMSNGHESCTAPKNQN
jgi:hypothetical protein